MWTQILGATIIAASVVLAYFGAPDSIVWAILLGGAAITFYGWFYDYPQFDE